MKIDWKHLCQTTGYRSLKDAVIRDLLSKRSRPKEECYKLFYKIIDRAKHYAVRQDRTVEEVLNDWEKDRTMWWFGYYTDSVFKKLPSGKPANVQHMKLKTWALKANKRKVTKREFEYYRDRKTSIAKTKRQNAGKKPRYSPARKRARKTFLKYRSL